MAEATIALATLSRDFALRMAPGAPPVVPVARLTLRPGEELPMLLDRAPG